MTENRQPAYRLVVKDKLSLAQTTVGAAWVNKAGGITINLGPGVALTPESLRDCYLTLWPWTAEPKKSTSRDRTSTERDDHRGYIADDVIDDIPF